MFELFGTDTAAETFSRLKQDPSQPKCYKAITKTLELLVLNPRHNSLQTHDILSLRGPRGEKVFEVYAEQKTSAAYRVFWYYGPGKGRITIIAITPHP